MLEIGSQLIMAGVPDPVVRFVNLFCGPGYLWLLAVLLSRSTGHSMQASIMAVSVGGVALIVLLSIISVRFYDPDQHNSRWTIGTMMLATAVLAIYLAYIGQFLSQLRGEPVTVYGIVVVSFVSCFFMAATTIVMLYFADTVLSILGGLLALFRFVSGKKQ